MDPVLHWDEVVAPSVQASNHAHYNHEAVVIGPYVYVFGGTFLYSNYSWLSDQVLRLEHVNRSWTKVSVKGDRFLGRTQCSTSLVDDCVYLFGGYNGKFLEEVYEYDVVFATWKQLGVEEMSFEGACLLSANYVQFVKKVVLFGGKTARGAVDRLQAYDHEVNKVSLLRAKGQYPKPRYNHASCCVNDKLFIIAGRGNYSSFNDIHMLTFKTNSLPHWSKLYNGGIFRTQLSPRAVFTEEFGGTLLIYDGQSLFAFYPRSNKAERVVPASSLEDDDVNEVLPLVTIGIAPKPQRHHRFVALNKREFLVIGGLDEGRIKHELNVYYMLKIT